jgi:O-antigen/teichoic acid export membrane protein
MLKSASEYLKNLILYFGASLIPMLVNLAINPLIAMNMSPEDYAINGYYTSFTSLISPVVLFYMLHYYNKRYFELDENGRCQLKALVFKSLLYFSFSIAVVCLLLLIGYLSFIKVDLTLPKYPYVILTVMAIPFTGVFYLEQADCRMSKNSLLFFKLSIFAAFLLIGFNLLLVVILKLGALGKLLAPFISNVLVFGFIVVKRKEYFSIPSYKPQFVEMVKFCTPLTIGAMLGYFSNGFDKTCLESIGDITEYGYYCVGSSMAAYLMTFSSAVNSTFQPDIYESIISSNNKKLIATSLVQLVIISLIVLLFIIFCPFIIRILTAGRYMASIPYARIIALSTITSSLYYLINNYTIAKGYPRLYMYTTALGSLAIILIMPLAISRFRFNGGAWMVGASFVLLCLANILLLLYVRRRNR